MKNMILSLLKSTLDLMNVFNTVEFDLVLKANYLELLQKFYPSSYDCLTAEQIKRELALHLNDMIAKIDKCTKEISNIFNLAQTSIIKVPEDNIKVVSIKNILTLIAAAIEDHLGQQACANAVLSNPDWKIKTFNLVNGTDI